EETKRSWRCPAVGLRADDRVDERHQPPGHRRRACEVVALMGGRVARLRHEAKRENEGGDADRDVDEEDPGPREILRQRAAEEAPDGGAADRDSSPDSERPCALRALLEGGRDDRKRGGGDERGAEALKRTCADEHSLASGQAVEERSSGEDDEAGKEDTLATKEVAETATEEQEPAKDKRVRVDDPLQA